MKGLGRALLFALAGVLAAVVIAVAWYALTFDPNAYRDDIAALVRDATGRELVIEGDLQATLFPSPGVEVGTVRLGQAAGFGTTPFATLTRADADLRLWPLIRYRRIEFGRVRIRGTRPRAAPRARRSEQLGGSARARARGKVPEARLMPGSIELSAAEVEEATVHYVDEQKHREYDLSDGSLALNGIAIGAPFALNARFRLASGGRAVQVRTGADVLIDEGGRVELKTPSVALEVPAGGARDGIEIALEAPSPATPRTSCAWMRRASKSIVARKVTYRCQDRSPRSRSRWPATTRLAVTAPALDVELKGEHVPGGGTHLRAEAPALAARVEAQTLSVRRADGRGRRSEASGDRRGDGYDRCAPVRGSRDARAVLTADADGDAGATAEFDRRSCGAESRRSHCTVRIEHDGLAPVRPEADAR